MTPPGWSSNWGAGPDRTVIVARPSGAAGPGQAPPPGRGRSSTWWEATGLPVVVLEPDASWEQAAEIVARRAWGRLATGPGDEALWGRAGPPAVVGSTG